MQDEERGTGVPLPHLAESLVSATVVKWLKHPGDFVHEYEVLCELETDKVNVEMPSPVEGTLLRILVREGETADVGASICVIREPESRGAETVEAPAAAERQEVRERAGGRARYSPAVLYLAEQHSVDLSKVTGTALGGRISRKDVLAYVGSQLNGPPDRSLGASERLIHDRSTTVAAGANDEKVPVTPVRKVIAQRVRQSAAEIPHAWLTVEADVTNLTALREKWKDRFAAKEGIRLTVTPFVIKAIVNAIKDYPIVNSSWEQDHILIKKEIHLSVAVGSEESVVTPVIRHADRKTIAGLAVELDDLVKRAKTGKLTLSDVQGGTFTFNNTGAFGSLQSFPIINYPQAAIITFEAIVRKPVVFQHDMIAIRSMANLCLSLDHRILDGTVCGRFLQRVKRNLEQYGQDTAIY